MLEKCNAAIRSCNAAHGCFIPADLKALMPSSIRHHAEAALPNSRVPPVLRSAEIHDYPKSMSDVFPPPFEPEKVRPSHVSLAGCVDAFRNNLCTEVVTVTVLGLFP